MTVRNDSQRGTDGTPGFFPRGDSGRRTRAAVFAVALALCGSLLGASSSATAAGDDTGIGIEIADDAATGSNDLRARSYLVDETAPGGHLERTVRVHNGSEEDHRVHVYSGPAEIRDGVFAVDDPAGPDISEWVVPATDTVDLPAGASADVPVRIDVPSDAPESEFYGAVWAELRSPSSDDALVLANRVGVRVYLSVGSGTAASPDFTISDLRLSVSAPKAELLADVVNTGSSAVDLSGEAVLRAAGGGITLGPLKNRMLTLAPGQSGTVAFGIATTQVEGTWAAELTLTSGLVSRTAHGDVEYTPAAAPAQEAGADSVPAWVVLAAAVAAALILFFALRASILRARPRSGR